LKKKRQQWLRRRRGTPAQIGTPFPLSAPRTPMQVKTFKENLRKLRPVRKDSPFQTPNPFAAQEEQVTEEQPEIEEEYVQLEDGSEARIKGVVKSSPSPIEVYNRVKDTVTTVLDKLGIRKKPKPKFEEIEIESNAE
jgi:hypothetical protein